MEWLGEGSRKQFGDDIWVKRWFANQPPDGNVVFDDVRNPDEAEAIQAAGGLIIRITHEKADMTAELPSERKLSLIVPDFSIHNTGDDRYRARVRALLSGLVSSAGV